MKLGVLNQDGPAELYSRIPCRIGQHYMRLMVDGELLACCVADRMAVGAVGENGDWREAWLGDRYAAFREKTGRIHLEKFHLSESEWAFCQQCPHEDINRRAARGIEGD